MENKECVLIKKKDLDKLEAESKAKKPDYININLFDDNHYIIAGNDSFKSNLNLHDNLLCQILRIARLHKKSVEEYIQKKYLNSLNNSTTENLELRRQIKLKDSSIELASNQLKDISNKFNRMTVREFRKYKKNGEV